MAGAVYYRTVQSRHDGDAADRFGLQSFVYATALNSAYDTASRVFTAATVLKDEKKIFTYSNQSYAANNYGDFFSNKEITLRDALVKSKNTITVDLGMQVNIGKVMNLAHKAGMQKRKAYPSMALGTAEATPLQVAPVTPSLPIRRPRAPTRSHALRGDAAPRGSESRQENVIRADVAYMTRHIED